MQGDDTDEDFEAQLAAELARLEAEDAVQTDSEDAAPRPEGPVSITTTDDDEDDEDEGDSAEPESLKAWMAMVSEKDAKLLQFEQELQQAAVVVDTAVAGATAEAASLPTLAGEQQQQRQPEGDPAAPAAAAREPSSGLAHGDAGTAGDAEHPSILGDRPTGPVLLQGAHDVQAAIQGLQGLLQQGGGAGASALLGDADDQAESVPAEHAGALNLGTNAMEEAAEERAKLYEEYRQEDERRQQERQRARQEAEARERQAAEEAEARLRAEAEAQAREQAARLAMLEAEAEAARQRSLAAEQERERERQKMESERQVQEERRAARVAEAARRQRQMEELMREVEQAAVEDARRHLAVARILRAWRKYRSGPVYAARLRMILGVQAVWRAVVARRQHKQLAMQRDVLQRLEDAASKGQLDAAREALQMAGAVGMASEVQQRVAVMEAQAKEAAQKLTAAAASGMAMAFRSALDAAKRFTHLSGLVEESSRVFEGRQAECLAELRKAVESQPLQEVNRAADSASQMGTPAASTSAALTEARQRDASVTSALAAAAAAEPFDAQEFQRLMTRATQLGLGGDASAARLVLERRRAAVVAEFQARAAAPGPSAGAEEVHTMATRARALGMEREAVALEQQLASKQQQLVERLKQAADAGSAAGYEQLMLEAERLGLDSERLAPVRQALVETQATVLDSLRQQAQHGTLVEFKEARALAIRAGCSEGAELAHRQVVQRRREAAASLSSALLGQWLLVRHSSSPQQSGLMAAMLAAATTLQQELGVEGEGDLTAAQAVASQAPAKPKPGQEQPKQGKHGALPGSCLGRPLPVRASSLLEAARAGTNDKGMVFPSPGSAAAALWQALCICQDLGLSPNVALSLSVAMLHCKVQEAAGAVQVAEAVVCRDYWGTPQLSSWPELHGSQALEQQAAGTGAAAAAVDAVAAAAAKRLASASNSMPVWPAIAHHRALSDLYRRFVSGSSDEAPSSLSQSLDVAEHAPEQPRRPRPAAQQQQRRTCAPAGAGSVPLTQALVRSLAPGLQLDQVVRLDLGLERLSTLAGLSAWCPRLQVLLVNSNHLTTLEGLDGLGHLKQLSLKDNYLAASASSAGLAWAFLPSSLHSLSMDANGLQQLPCLSGGLPQLHELTLTDNELRSLDLAPTPPGGAPGMARRPQPASLASKEAAQQLPCTSLALLAPCLSTLDLSGNCLVSLMGLTGCINLVSLDVSRNSLATLEGVEHCLMLQSLDASANQLSACSLLPWPSQTAGKTTTPNGYRAEASGAPLRPHLTLMPYQQLRRLDLSRNLLTKLQDVPPMPALQTLILQENNILTVSCLDALPSLTCLDLSFNALPTLECVQALAPLVALQKLRLNDNPATADKQAYDAAVATMVPWVMERDGDAPSLLQAAASATRAASQSVSMATAAMAAFASGALLVLPSAPAAGLWLQPYAAGSQQPALGAAAAAAEIRHRAGAGSHSQGQAITDSQAATALRRARLLHGVACTSQGAPAAAGVPLELLTSSSSLAPVVSLQQAPPPPSTPAAYHSAGTWLETVESAFAAAGVTMTAATHVWDDAAAASLRLPPAGPAGTRMSTAAPGGWVAEGDEQSSSAWLSRTLLDRKPLAQLSSKLAGRLGRLDLSQGNRRHMPSGPTGVSSSDSGMARTGQSAGAGAVSKGAGRSVSAAESLQQMQVAAVTHAWAHEEGARFMRSQQHQEASRAALAAYGREGLQFDGEFEVRVAYCGALLQETQQAAECMQAVWRARQARRLAMLLRSEQHQQAMDLAAIRLQAAWRGALVRRSPDLAERRRAAAVAAQAVKDAEQQRRDGAAARIQAAARGFCVRRRLKAAQQAARYVDEDEEDFDFDAGADELLSGLKGVEDFLRAEQPAFMAAATAAMSNGSVAGQVTVTPRMPVPPQAPPPPAFVAQPPSPQNAVALLATQPRAVELAVMGARSGVDAGVSRGLLDSNRPQSLQIPAQPPAPAGWLASSQGAAVQSVQAWVEAHPGPQGVSPPGTGHTVASSQPQLQGGQPWAQAESSVISPSAASQVSPGGAASDAGQLLKQQKYREKLEALMKEWGFKDLATAEVYYRRQRRQARHVQGKGDGRYRDPGVRLKKLQEAVAERERLRPEDVQRVPQHGPEVQLNRGALQGPPSRRKERDVAGAAAEPDDVAAAAPARQRQQQAPPRPPHAPLPRGHSLALAVDPQGWQSPGRQVVSADAALPSISSFGSNVGGPGAGLAVSDSGQGSSWTGPPPRAGAGARPVPSGQHRSPPQASHPHQLPPLPAAQQREQQFRRSMAMAAEEESDRLSIHSALSDGVLMQRKPALAPLQQVPGSIGRAVAAGHGPCSKQHEASSSVGRQSLGSVVLPAMPGAPSVNRWVLVDDAGQAAGPLHVRTAQLLHPAVGQQPRKTQQMQSGSV